MINKQNLWFLTLITLILVLSIYYITMPNELLITAKKTTPKEEPSTTTTVEEVSSLVAMRVSLEEERQTVMDDLQKKLTTEDVTNEEKNNVYEQLKYLNEVQGKEEALEKSIKEKYKLDCFVKIDNSNVDIVCISEKHDNTLANNLMRLVQENYKNKMFITIKFQKK